MDWIDMRKDSDQFPDLANTVKGSRSNQLNVVTELRPRVHPGLHSNCTLTWMDTEEEPFYH
jgi:hypothetical protein